MFNKKIKGMETYADIILIIVIIGFISIFFMAKYGKNKKL